MRKENVQKTACNLQPFLSYICTCSFCFTKNLFPRLVSHVSRQKTSRGQKLWYWGKWSNLTNTFPMGWNHYLVNYCLYSLSIKTDMFLFTATLLQHRNPLFGPSPERPWNSLWLAEDVPDFLRNSRLLKVAMGCNHLAVSLLLLLLLLLLVLLLLFWFVARWPIYCHMSLHALHMYNFSNISSALIM